MGERERERKNERERKKEREREKGKYTQETKDSFVWVQVSVANSRTYSNGVPVLTERGLPVGPVRDLLEGSILRLCLFPSLSTLATVSVRLDFEGGTDAERRTPRPRTDPLHAIRRGRLGACLPFLPFLPPL